MTDPFHQPTRPPQSPPPGPPFPPAPGPRPKPGRSVPIVLGPVVALVVGGVGGYLLGERASGQDLSVSGQISYACDLVEKIREDHQTADDWEKFGEDRAYDEVAAIVGLLGGFSPRPGEEADKFPDLGRQLYRSMATYQLDELNAVLGKTHTECEAR